MKLYDWKIAPNPRRVRMYLAEKGIEVPTEQAAEPNAMGLRDDYLAKGAHRLVPLLELDDGTCIGEAMAICRYFEAEHPEPPLFGRSPKEKALVEMWERISEIQGLHAAAENFRNAIPAFAGRALPGYAEPVEQIPALAERGRMRYSAFLKKLDQRLGEARFLAGDDYFSVADITAFCTLDFAKNFRLPIPEDHAHLRRWYEEVQARPSATASA